MSILTNRLSRMFFLSIKVQRYYDLDYSGSRDVICRVIIALAIWGFLWVVNLIRSSISHEFLDIKLQRYDRDISWSRDVIGHERIGLAIWGFLLVVNMNRPFISHSC